LLVQSVLLWYVCLLYVNNKCCNFRSLLAYCVAYTVVTGSIVRSAMRRYLIYSEADFEVFRPAGATRGPLLRAKFHPHRCNDGCRTPKTEIFTQI